MISMTASKTLLLKHLGDLVIRFPKIKASYRYDSLAKSHLVEILPKEVFEANKELKKIRRQITRKLIELDPTDAICWFSEDDLVSIETPENEFVGVLFGETSDIDFDVLSSIFEKYTPILTRARNLITTISYVDSINAGVNKIVPTAIILAVDALRTYEFPRSVPIIHESIDCVYRPTTIHFKMCFNEPLHPYEPKQLPSISVPVPHNGNVDVNGFLLKGDLHTLDVNQLETSTLHMTYGY